MSTSPYQQDLHTPLLGDEIIDIDEEQAPHSTHKRDETDKIYKLEEEEHDNIDNDDDDDEADTYRDGSCIVSMILPLLLLIQFGMSGFDEVTAASSSWNISWWTIGMNVFLFAVATWCHQGACKDSKVQSMALILLPEIMTNIVLGTLVFGKVMIAFTLLNLGSLLLCALALVATVHSLFFVGLEEDDEEERDGEDQQPYLLIV